MNDYENTLRNTAGSADEQDVSFYQVQTGYSEGSKRLPEIGQLTPLRFYGNVLATWGSLGSLSLDQYASAVIEGTWYSVLQPEYKAYPAIIAALAATKIEIGCEHLRMPFPAIAVRLPEGFMQEPGGPAIRCVFAVMMKNYDRLARPVTSIDSDPMPNALTAPFAVSLRKSSPEHVLMIQAKYIDNDGDDAFANFTIGLQRGKTIEEMFSGWLEHSETLEASVRERIKASGYLMGDQLARELLSLVIGVSFFATGRTKSSSPILQRDKRPRHERRRFEKEHDGQEQPTFSVGRELVLPREPGAPAKDAGPEPGEGAGRSLRWAHYRCGHLRYQAHGEGRSERKLIFIEPTLVRPDLPVGTRVTPGAIVGGSTRDVTESS